ncbi:hypothetical protein [Desmospora activa]|uniref:DUF2178 domain-containing protein n=1 Tax=Desmospora activa DSM 45169 TaxID=1121389 RepID=A0A2T4Z927_9BACL|nr:hypothetical protein [Desmospora activa]PTM58394.1 hypothetical protein C8J48_0976 [Desmospora activa DSM 45169]
MDTTWILFSVAFIGTALITVVLQKKQRQKSQIPEVDERVLKLFQVYVLRTLIVSGIVGVILLSVFAIIGYKNIPLNYIWLYLLATMLALAICSIVAKKK